MSTRVTARANIPLPIEACWEKLRDLTRARHYVPGLTDCVITTEAKEGVGASRCVSHQRFGDMDETVARWDEGEGFTLRLHKGNNKSAGPFKEATFRYALEGAGAQCEIVTTMTYVLRLGVLGSLFDVLIMRRVSQGNVRDVALALAEYYVTEEPVLPGRLAELRRGAR